MESLRKMKPAGEAGFLVNQRESGRWGREYLRVADREGRRRREEVAAAAGENSKRRAEQPGGFMGGGLWE
jgi:hypothetical protein